MTAIEAQLQDGDFVNVFVEIAVLRRIPTLAETAGLRAAGVRPILGLGIVKAEFEPPAARRLGQRADEILTVGRRIGDIPFGGLRREQRERL